MKAVLCLLIVLAGVAVVLCAPPRPAVATSYSGLFIQQDGKEDLMGKIYFDNTGKFAKYRFDDLAENTTELILNQNSTHLIFNATTCTTYCNFFAECPDYKKFCNATVADIFTYIADATYAGACTGGNMWNYSYSGGAIAFCVTDDNVPTELVITSSRDSVLISISDWIPGAPKDPDTFDNPIWCPCMHEPVEVPQPKIQAREYRFDISRFYFLKTF